MIRFLFAALLSLSAFLPLPVLASFPATSDPTACTAAPCYGYETPSIYNGAASGYLATPSASCEKAAANSNAATQPYNVLNPHITSGGGYGLCAVDVHSRSSGAYLTSNTYTVRMSPVEPTPPVYSCPSGATLSGSSCTCTAPAVETGSPVSCVVPPVCGWAAGLSYAAGMGTFTLQRGKNHCYGGCAFAVDPAEPPSFGIKIDGIWYDEVRMGNLIGTGGVAANCGSGDASAPPTTAPPETPPTAPVQPPCPAGQTSVPQTGAPGTTGYVCVTPTESTSQKKTSGSITDPAGAVTTTSTTNTTICNSGGCTTTTNTSVSSGGTTQTTSESSTQGKDAFCKSNPSDKNCTGTADGMGTNPGSGADQGSPDHPKLWEKKYPDGLAGVWAAKKTALLNTDIGKLAPSLMPNNIPQNAALPVWNLPLDFGPGMNYGSHNVAPTAEIWGWAKVFLIISALLLARALIFGG
ncbi:MAG: hypothetical protein Q8K86_10565 [Candidatus Nanopelagicaceae bacterium]|nr:hypothetical protein [Candidatus Nanopelagicaceae bacterium]